MRKNQFRSILLASLVVTAIGGFNSCKDYDDDIDELRNEIRTNSTDLNSLVADKVHNLEIEANNLQAQLSSLETAYKNADAALQTSINNAVTEAKSYAAGEAASKADAAQKAAESYADIKAAEAQRAAIAAATGLVNDAKKSLEDAIKDANNAIADQGKTISGLLEADKKLQDGINEASAKANEAWALANQALEKANAALTNADKAKDTADEAKQQAAQNAGALQTLSDNLKSTTENLQNQINIFGPKATDALSKAEANAAEIERTKIELSDLRKADEDALKQIGDLETELKDLIENNLNKIKVLEKGLDDVKSDISDIQGDIKDLQAAVADLITADTDLEKSINGQITEINGKIATLTNDVNNDVKDLRSIITDLQTGKIASLDEAVDELTKKLEGVATSGDVEGVKGQIEDLQKTLKNLQTTVNTLTADKATKEDIAAAIEELGIAGLTSRIEALEGVATTEKIAAAAKAAAEAAAKQEIDQLKEEIQSGSFNQDLSGINTDIAKLQEDYSKIEEKIANEVSAKVNELKPDIIKELTKTLSGSIESGDDALQDEIDILVQILADYMGIDLSDEESEVKLFAAAEEGNSKAATLLEKLQEQVKNVSSASDVINNTLESISLIPQLYIDGIEAIEFTSLDYIPVVPGTSGLTPNGTTHVYVNNGEAEAYYRLNPATVKLDQVDVENIKYYAATAETRAPSVASPVEFNGIKSYAGGLLGVYLKKAKGFTGDLTTPDPTNPKIKYIVALSVPRKANPSTGVEAREIVSENSLVHETWKQPKIARLPWKTDATLNGKDIHHYSDSTTLYESKVDADPLEMVYEKVEYNKTYDVLAHVTGCNVKGGHEQITKDQLKKYGLTFRFAIPTKEYKQDAEHKTNQQAFATIDNKTGIVSSKLPNGVVDNKACVGKEPIIRIMLVDTVNNKLVDERYMKIKWVEKEKEPVTLDPLKSTSELK